MEKDEIIREQQEEVLKETKEQLKKDNENVIKSAAKLSTSTIIIRIVEVILLVALIPVAYFAIVTKGFTDGWYRDFRGGLHNHNFPWDRRTATQQNNGRINVEFKPIIYLYPTEEMKIEIKLGNKEMITCSYPKYTDGWNVIARPDGRMTYLDTGKDIYSLYWEGIPQKEYAMDEGFIVKGEDSASFLEEKLELLGLNYKEAEEMIVYWLPKLEANKYNFIKFLSMEEMNANMPIDFSVEPDSLIRIRMAVKGLEEPIDVPEQKLTTPKREGFVAVEWGGIEL